MTEYPKGPEIDVSEVIARLDPCDLIIVEGYKSQPIPKIEARRRESAPGAQLSEQDEKVVAIAADYAIDDSQLPVFELNDVVAIADFLTEHLQVRKVVS